MRAIPTPNQIKNVLDVKNVLDGVAAVFFPIFGWVYQALAAQGFLTADEVLDEQVLLGLDGTEYFSSAAIHCPQCSHKGGQVNYHPD